MRTARHTLIAIGAIAATATIGAAQQRGTQPQSETQPRATQATAGLPESSAQFVARAAEASAAEIAQAKLALTRASHPEVKAFAQRMVQDHQTLSTALTGAAADQKLTPATRAAESRAIGKLQELSGAEFDREYMGRQVAQHEEAIRLFEHQSQQGNDATIRDFAQKNLATLRDHMKMAQDILGKLSK